MPINPEQLNRVPQEYRGEKEAGEDRCPRERLIELRDNILDDTEEARKAEILKNYQELLPFRDHIRAGEKAYSQLIGYERLSPEERKDMEEKFFAGLLARKGITVEYFDVEGSPTAFKVSDRKDYIERMQTWAEIKKEESNWSLEEWLGEGDYIAGDSEEDHQKFLERARKKYLGVSAQIFGFGNAALEHRDPRNAVLAYKIADLLEHENVVEKLEKYAREERDPVRHRELAEILQEALSPVEKEHR